MNSKQDKVNFPFSVLKKWVKKHAELFLICSRKITSGATDRKDREWNTFFLYNGEINEICFELYFQH
jgi:hypothetical protein